MKVAIVFPGQGSQQVGMGSSLCEGLDEVKALYKEANEAMDYDLMSLSFNGPDTELNLTMRTQPCLLAAGYAAYTALIKHGIKPEAVAGHSLGEYTALVASGVLSFRDGLLITERRGRLMQDAVPEGKGLMSAVLGLDREQIDAICLQVASGYVAAANYNCPGQVVISGEKPAVEEAMVKLKAAGAKRVLPLSVSVPSHCKLMDGTSKKLSEYLFLGEITMNEPKIPVVSNSDAIFLTSVEGIKAALVKQLNSPVLWEDVIKTMVASGIDTFIEAGPGKVLSGLIKRIDPTVRILNVEDTVSLDKTIAELKAA